MGVRALFVTEVGPARTFSCIFFSLSRGFPGWHGLHPSPYPNQMILPFFVWGPGAFRRLALLAFTAVMMSLAILRFRKRLD